MTGRIIALAAVLLLLAGLAGAITYKSMGVDKRVESNAAITDAEPMSEKARTTKRKARQQELTTQQRRALEQMAKHLESLDSTAMDSKAQASPSGSAETKVDAMAAIAKERQEVSMKLENETDAEQRAKLERYRAILDQLSDAIQ